MRPRTSRLALGALVVLIGVVVASVIPLASPAEAAAFSYNAATGLPMPIPDDNPAGATNTMVVTGNGNSISDLDVGVQISHTYVGHLIVTLTHVDTGTNVVIIDRPGYTGSGNGCSENDIAATLSDEAASPVEAECAGVVPTINGSFSPNNPLSAFDGEAVDGTWALNVADVQNSHTGSLTGWSISGNDTNVVTRNLTVNKAGTGTGTVGDGGGLSCGASCSSDAQSYPDGTVVTLTASAEADSVFAGWSGSVPASCSSGTPAICNVTMNADKTVVATFNLAGRTLTVNKAGMGRGMVSDGGPISCATTCTSDSAGYAHGTVVTLTATADPSSQFAGWSGDVPAACSIGRPASCQVTMDADRSVKATFDPASPESLVGGLLGFPILDAPGWWKYLLGSGTANVNAAGTAPDGWGEGSLEMTTGSNQAIASTHLVLAPGITNISSISELSYWTYSVPNPSGSPKVPTLQLSVDVDGDLLWDTNLVYEPSFNGNVVSGEWQQWNTLDGVWYSTQDIGIADQDHPRTLREIFNSHDQAYFEMAFSLLASDPGGDLRLQFGSSGGGYPGSAARVDGIEFQVGALPEVQTDFEDPVSYLLHLVGGLTEADGTPFPRA